MDEPYELYIIDKTFDELEKIITTGKNKAAARFALKFIEKTQFNIIKTEINKNNVDKEILALDEGNIIVATQDKDLKKKLKEKRIPVIIVRQKNHLILENQ